MATTNPRFTRIPLDTRVLGTGRTLAKAEEACASIEGNTTPLECELTDFDNVAACAEQVKSMGIRLDGLILNAGIMALQELEQAARNAIDVEALPL